MFVLLGLCGLALLWSLASGVAAVAAWQAGVISTQVSVRGLALGGAEDRLVRRRFATAQRLEPGNPRQIEGVAQHLDGLAGNSSVRPEVRRQLAQEAYSLYLASAARRPTWPYTLNAVLHTEYALGRVGPEFARHYVRALEIGRGETVARRSLVALGLAAWPALTPDTRDLVQALVRHDLMLDPRNLIEQALRLGRGALVEPLIGDDPERRQIYADLRAQVGVRR